MLTIYGIPNCDTCRRARRWLEKSSVEHQFHDLRTDGLCRNVLTRWTGVVGWQKLLNTRSTTWRGIPQDKRQDMDEEQALELMLKHPTLIKRPLLVNGNRILVGFSDESYAERSVG